MAIRTGADEVDVIVDAEKTPAPGHQVRVVIRLLYAGSVDCSLGDVVVAPRVNVAAGVDVKAVVDVEDIVDASPVVDVEDGVDVSLVVGVEDGLDVSGPGVSVCKYRYDIVI